MNGQTDHTIVGHSRFLPGSAVLVGVALTATICLFYGWYFLTGRVLSSAVDLPLELVIPSLALPMLAAFIISHNERLWVFLALSTVAVFIFRVDDGRIKAEEIFYAVFVLSGIIIWFVKEMVFFRRRVVRTSFDVLFLTSWVLTNSVAAIATAMHGGDWLVFTKELLVHLTFLLYFPMRSAVRNRRQLLAMLGIVVGLAVVNGIHSALTYQQRVVESALEFGFVAARVASQESLSVMLAIISFTLLAYARRAVTFIAGAAGTAAGIAFVIISLSRGPIASMAVGMLMVAALVPIRKGLKLLAVLVAIIGVNLAALTLIAPTFASSILTNVGDRLSTMNKLQTDLSLGSRVAESDALLNKYVPASPIIGYGYGVRYAFFDDPNSHTAKPYFIHNGYVYPLYKFGIPAGLFFLFMLFYPLVKSVYVHPPRDAGFMRALFAGAVGMLIANMLTNLTSCKFESHPDVALLVITFVVFDFVWRTTPADRSLLPVGNR